MAGGQFQIAKPTRKRNPYLSRVTPPMLTPSRLPPRAWLVVALLWVVVTFNFLARLMLTTMHGSILGSIPMTETQFGLLTTSLLCAYGLVSPCAGFLADRFSRSRVIIVSLIAWSAITWLTAYARTFEQLLILRSLMGVSEACYIPAGLALVNDYHRDATRSLATGIHQSGIFIGMALAGLGGYLAERRSWHYAFSVVGAVGIGYGLLLVLLLRDAPRAQPDGEAAAPVEPPVDFRAAMRSLFSQGAFVLALVNWGMLGTISWVVFGWMPLFLQEHFHLGQGAAGLSATFYANVAALSGLLAGGAWADRWAGRQRRARMYVPALGLLVAAPCLFCAATTSVLGYAILGVVFYRVFSSFVDANMMPILCEVIDRRYRATAYGLLNLTGVFGAGIGVYVAGVLRDSKIDLSKVFVTVAVVTLASPVMFYCIKPRDGAPPAAASS